MLNKVNRQARTCDQERKIVSLLCFELCVSAACHSVQGGGVAGREANSGAGIMFFEDNCVIIVFNMKSSLPFFFPFSFSSTAYLANIISYRIKSMPYWNFLCPCRQGLSSVGLEGSKRTVAPRLFLELASPKAASLSLSTSLCTSRARISLSQVTFPLHLFLLGHIWKVEFYKSPYVMVISEHSEGFCVDWSWGSVQNSEAGCIDWNSHILGTHIDPH